MALFKLLRGQESDLVNQPLHDGYVWVTKDLQNMWFDYYDETNTLVRKRINSEYADKLRYVKDGETVELDPSAIVTKAELTNALAGKANTSHNHDDKYYTETEVDNKLASKADKTHNHSAENITSGVLSTDRIPVVPISKGGTGSTTSASALKALGVIHLLETGTDVNNVLESGFYRLSDNHANAFPNASWGQMLVIRGDLSSDTVTQMGFPYRNNTAYFRSGTTSDTKADYIGDKEWIRFDGGDLREAIDGKQAAITGAATTITDSNLTTDRALIANGSGKVAVSDVTSTELGYLDGVTSNIQTQLNAKAASSHNHNDVYYTETEVDTKLDNKVDKVNGKGLSTNDYTTTEKNKLAGIAEGANKYVLPSATDSVVGGMKLYTSTGTNTAGTMTQKAITDALSGKSGTGHNHDSVYSKLGHTHTAAEVGASTEAYVDNQIVAAKSYTDTKVAGLVDSAPETLNTLNELASALGDDPNFATTMANELGTKATKTELSTHASSNIHITSAERTNWNAAKTHADSAHAPSNAERNIIVGIQKNGTDVTVNSSTRKVNITVPTKTSELTNNSDFATNASVTSVKDELQANIDGKAASSHNHAASNITSGTLSSDRLPTVPVAKGGTGATTAAGALTNLGLTATAAELNVLDGITATTAELNKLDGVTATTAELNYVDGVTSNIQTQLNGKASTTHAHDMKELEGFFIELNNKGTKGTGHGGYLDFHYDGSGADYTSRIIESANGTLSVNGVKCASSGVTCSSVNITNGAQKNKTGGFVKLNNGVILQWGTVANVANGTSTWVNFPLTFPNSVGGTAMLTGNYGNSFGYELHANDISASGFTIVKKGGSSTSGTDTVSWLVVGW